MLEHLIRMLELQSARGEQRLARLEQQSQALQQQLVSGLPVYPDPLRMSCAYEDLPDTLKWTQANAAGLSKVTYLTKTSDFSAYFDVTDTDLTALSGKRGWIGDCEPAQVGRGTAYRVVWEVSARVYKIDHVFGGTGNPYLGVAPNLGRENLSTTKTCSQTSSPTFRLTATSVYFGAITVIAHREQPGSRPPSPPPPGPDFDPRRFD